ncbi:related to UDP-glucuronate 5'-epimerase [Ramularia collo-cygni]|uniref:Related to UDP-glucuronate 5'-epimerase n=1 Tax=Ramularia collo-cygni TaxID=112498 RepID=A0A2D3VEA6_9PEZI|nr:related to UDP-glucuronate 5'-epimerase [Ramularia collo-cygni]CZT20069.1 related to UDP-glucuronate 5'-epimerase [Ramularia collo-cygni]
MRTALVTGSAGFVGSFVSERLLREGYRVVGLDSMNDYYEVSLKERRNSRLLDFANYHAVHALLETPGILKDLFERERFDIVIHLAAQAGVRHSIENPRSYLDSNVVGTFELLEAARAYPPRHMLLASSSSVYGARMDMDNPYREIDRTDHQVSFYAATKKAMESMAHSYAHLYNLPITVFRFFTVYGPWGRPDMALFKFTKAILQGDPIDVYNHGDMKRDFTYIDDLVEAVCLLVDAIPERSDIWDTVAKSSNHQSRSSRDPLKQQTDIPESLSPVAPWRVVNIGNSEPVQLTDFIEAIEDATGFKAKRKLLPMQAGDVQATWADAELLRSLTGYRPKTSVQDGVLRFVEWYRGYYSV